MEEIWDLDKNGKHWQQIKPLTLNASAWSNLPAKSGRASRMLSRSEKGAISIDLEWNYNQMDSYFDALKLGLVGDYRITEDFS